MRSECFGSAWKAYKKNFPALILGIIIIGIVAAIIALPFGIPLAQYAQANNVALTQLGKVIQQQQTMPSNNLFEPYFELMRGFMFKVFFIILGIAIAGALIFPLKVGLTKLYQEALKGEKVKLDLMFKYAKEKFKSSVGTMLLLYLIFIVAIVVSLALIITFAYTNIIGIITTTIILVILGNILLRMFLSLTAQSLAVSNANTRNAILLSYQTVKKNFIEFLGLVIIFFVATILLNQFSRIIYLDNFIILIFVFIVAPIKGLVYTKFYMNYNKKKNTRIKKPIKKQTKTDKKPKRKK